MFEIKSSRPGKLEEGQAEVTNYITAINRAMGPVGQFTRGSDFSGDFWARFALTMPYWRLTWRTTAPGVVQYQWTKLDNGEVDEVKIAKGVADGTYSWVDLTLADTDQYAEECAKFAQSYVDGSQKLYNVQMVADFVIGIIGNATMIYLSPGLSAPAKLGQPSVLPLPSRPTVTIPAPPPVPISRAPTTMRPRLGPPPGAPPARPPAPPPPR